MSHESNYMPCPCGRGKKVKFCCGAPVASELEKIFRSLAGDQRVAALNLTRVALKKAPDNPALLSLQCELEIQLQEREEGISETVDRLQQVLPESPVAFAARSLLSVQDHQLETAVERLQDALEATSTVMCEAVFHALVTVAHALWFESHFLAAMTHATLAAELAPEDSESLQELPTRMAQTPARPVGLRYLRIVREAAEGAPWGAVAPEILDDFSSGRWRKAASTLEALHAEGAYDADLLYNLAVLRTHLGQEKPAAAWLRQLARHPGVSRREAVEAEAWAQLLDAPPGQMIDRVRQVYEVEDLDPVMERLLANRRLLPFSVDPQSFTENDQPPPRAAFRIADFDTRRSAEELERFQDVPRSLAELLVFGKQTDRPARLELLVYRDQEHYPDITALVEELAGEGSRLESEEILGQTAAQRLIFSWNAIFPDDLPVERRRTLTQEREAHVLNELFPQLPMPWLEGKSPAEAAGDPEWQLPLLAAIENIEIQSREKLLDTDFQPLREKLGLPDREPVTAPFGNPWEMPLERILWLRDPAELDADQLSMLMLRCMRCAFLPACRRLLAEIERREDHEFGRQFDLDTIHQFIAAQTGDSAIALHHLSRAQELLEAKGRSPATVMLASLPHLLISGNAEEFQRVLLTLQKRHIQEPGIAEGLYELIQALQMGRPGPPADPATAGDQMPAAASEQKLWTPGGESPGPAGEKKPKLWVPGMD